ncbi:hypothetical protein CJF30_00009655 [Rutstroemia sp. NJR-2017a BBW]|nr:hypothetical protein CJF30_00009655 [Rutstroemia sp. NJR-2017a BBW]
MPVVRLWASCIVSFSSMVLLIASAMSLSPTDLAPKAI